MCGRVTLTRNDIADIADDLDAEIDPDDAARYRPRYNVAPSDLHWIVERGADRRVLVPAVWGYLASGRPLINVRGEQVGSGGGFREAFASRRCVVVTDGFFEWSTPKPAQKPAKGAAKASTTKTPFWYHRSDGGLVLLAGLYQSPSTPSPDAHQRFTILTTRPNRLVSMVHNRMPVVLAPDQIDDWLTAATTRAVDLISPAPEAALVATPVSKRVNSAKNDDPDCLLPADATSGAAPAPRQRSLF
jgi:putative SOS response-associated peptidase YedK